MALQKQVVPVPFTQGLDLKTDPKQVMQGKLLTLQNGIFTSPGRIMKRFGYEALSQFIEPGASSISSGSGLANFKNELLLLTGTEAYSYSDSTTRWTDKQTITNVQLTSTEVTRNTYEQVAPDVAIHPSGLEIVAYEDSRGGSRYTIIDSETGDQVISDLLITATAIKPKTFVLGNFLLITYVDTSDYHLRVLPIPVVTPSIPLPAFDLATNLNTTYPNYDCNIYDTKLYYTYYSSASGIVISYINQFLGGGGPVHIAGEVASSCVSLYVDQVLGQVWVAYHNGTEVKYFIFDATLPFTPLLAPTNISANSNIILNIALIVSNGIGEVYYTQTAVLPSNNFILEAALTNTGIVTDNRVFIRSVSIAGKPFTQGAFNYITVAFDSVLQPTYFTLRTIDAAVIVKFSPGVGGGTAVRNTIPEAYPDSAGLFLMGSLVKDLLTTISGTVYTQTGVNVIELDFTNAKAVSVELGANTHITGGLLNQYDGVSIVEHGFNIFPENVMSGPSSTPGGLSPGTYQYSVVYSWMDAQGQINYSAPSIGLTNTILPTPAPIYFTGTVFTGLTTLNVSSTVGLAIGDIVTDITNPSFISPGTFITGFTSNTINISQPIPGGVSIPTTDTLSAPTPGATTFQTVFTTGQTIIPVSSTAGLTVGQPLSDLTTPGNMVANTFITAVGTGNITISPATTGNSAGSPGDTVQVAAGFINFHATFFTGATTITVSNTANLFVGQIITDLTTGSNISAGTTITAINPATDTVTISAPTVGNSASAPGDLMQTADGFSVAVIIPTLRLTQKKPPVRTPVIIQVYRTESDQTIFYLVSSVTVPLLNDTTVDTVTFIDTSSDAAILGNPTLYTTGGVIENIAAPAFSYITTYQDRIIGLPEENKNQWWYSKQNIPGAPVEFTDSFVNNVDQAGGDLIACLKMDSELIFWRETQIYYITGIGPDSTGNQNDFSAPINIASDVGCIDKDSLVIFPNGVVFKSDKGIYLLSRGLALSYIGAPVEAYNQFDIVSADLMANTQQIRFCLENGVAIVYDYYVGQWSIFTNIPAVDSTIFQEQFTYLTANGLVLQETPGQYTDNGEFIQLTIQTAWLSFTGLQGFQRVYKMLFLGDYFNPHNVAVFAAYDFNPFQIQQNVTQVGAILSSNNYGNDPTYGFTTPFGGPPQTYQFRVDFNRQKCETIQITIQDQQLGASFGENLALSAFGFEVGTKGTLDKIVAQGTNTNIP